MAIAVRLRTLLAVTVVALTASIVLAGGWLLYTLWQRQREVVDRQNIELARAVSVAIDQSVENARAALTLMASVDVLDTDELTRFRELARRVIPRQPGWHSVLLADASGRLLINTAAQREVDGPSTSTEWAAPVIATLKPSFSNLVVEPGLPGYFYTVAVPVVRAGTLSHVLAVRIRSESLSAIIHQQQIPKNGVVTLIDGGRQVMARSRGEHEYVGRPPSADFLAAASRMTEGSWRSVLLEGISAYSALSRSKLN